MVVVNGAPTIELAVLTLMMVGATCSVRVEEPDPAIVVQSESVPPYDSPKAPVPSVVPGGVVTGTSIAAPLVL